MLNKKELRLRQKKIIEGLSHKYKQNADEGIFNKVINLKAYKNAKTIFIFVGVKDEINTSLIINHALEQGKTVTVPLSFSDGIMEARKINSLDDLHEAKFGLLESPKDTEVFTLEQIDLSFIPCLAADKKGNRLGYGGGYYDRFFSEDNSRAIILCREIQLLENVIKEDHDISFTKVLTEKNLYK